MFSRYLQTFSSRENLFGVEKNATKQRETAKFILFTLLDKLVNSDVAKSYQ